jgi:hypothetical protein
MRFERRFGAEQVYGWAGEKPIKRVRGAAESCRSVEEAGERVAELGRAHECIGVPKHLLGSRLKDGSGRIEVHAR